MVGKVDNPESIVYPVTPIETGEFDLLTSNSLPQENLPTGIDDVPVVAIPTVEVLDFMFDTTAAFCPEADIECT